MCGLTLESQSPGKGLIEVIKKKLSINSAALDPDYPRDHGLLSCFSSPMTSSAARWIDQAILDEDIAYSKKKRRGYLTGTLNRSVITWKNSSRTNSLVKSTWILIILEQ